MSTELRIDAKRLAARLDALGAVGAIPGGGVCRLALTTEDGAGRDLVAGWMRELGLAVTIDAIGNVVGVRQGLESGPPVMVGSHIDTVRTGGRYDGNLGVLAGLEVIRCLNDAALQTRRPLAVAFFTNEEGARFNPDMMGSLVYVGGLPLGEALATVGIDGESVGDCLKQIGYAGAAPCGKPRIHAYVELHVEQGPVLDLEGFRIGAVEGVQGISWTEFTVLGVSNHAGTTPMRLRHDAGYVACAIANHAREIARSLGGDQVATVGAINLSPNLVNVIANRAAFTVDSAQYRRGGVAGSRAATACVRCRRCEGRRCGAEPSLAGAVRAGGLQSGRRGSGRSDRAAPRPYRAPPSQRRRARRPDAGPGLSGRNDLRSERRWHQPQREGIHRIAGSRGRRQRAAAHPADAGELTT